MTELEALQARFKELQETCHKSDALDAEARVVAKAVEFKQAMELVTDAALLILEEEDSVERHEISLVLFQIKGHYSGLATLEEIRWDSRKGQGHHEI